MPLIADNSSSSATLPVTGINDASATQQRKRYNLYIQILLQDAVLIFSQGVEISAISLNEVHSVLRTIISYQAPLCFYFRTPPLHFQSQRLLYKLEGNKFY